MTIAALLRKIRIATAVTPIIADRHGHIVYPSVDDATVKTRDCSHNY